MCTTINGSVKCQARNSLRNGDTYMTVNWTTIGSGDGFAAVWRQSAGIYDSLAQDPWQLWLCVLCEMINLYISPETQATDTIENEDICLHVHVIQELWRPLNYVNENMNGISREERIRYVLCLYIIAIKCVHSL